MEKIYCLEGLNECNMLMESLYSHDRFKLQTISEEWKSRRRHPKILLNELDEVTGEVLSYDEWETGQDGNGVYRHTFVEIKEEDEL